MFRKLFPAAQVPVIKGVHVYFSKTGVIVAALHQNHAGILFEQDEPIFIEGEPNCDELGDAFRVAFERFSINDKNLSTAKKSEWPAYLASGCRSVKDFERKFRPIICTSTNASNTVVRATTAHPSHDGIELSVSFNPLLPSPGIGTQLLHLANAAALS
jgi:hypothetical protein